MVPPRCICFGYFIASYPPISPIRIPGYRPSCSCSFTSLIGGLLCLQAVTPTSYGYSHSHSGLSPFLLMFVHFPHREVCFACKQSRQPPMGTPIRIPGYRPSCSCSFTSLIGGLLCLQAVTPTSYGYSHSHSGLSPFLLMFVHFPHRRSALPASSHANLLWVSVMRQN